MRSPGDESGSVTLIVAFGMVVIMGFLALAIDVGQLRYQRRNLQRTADAAALAGAMEVSYCDGTNACPTMQTAATSALVENNMTPATVLTNCAAAPSTGLVLTVNNPPCALGSADPNAGKAAYVEAVVTQAQPSLFAQFLGYTSVPVSARAEAARSGSNCIYALNPTGPGALTVAALASVTSPCGVVVESSSPSAVLCALGASIAVSRLSVVGGVTNVGCSIIPAAKTGSALPVPLDPLAYLPAPAIPSCGTSTSSPYHGANASVTALPLTTTTFYPDYAYCGGIVILPGATAVFQPGTYVLRSNGTGGGLTVNLGSSVTGTGVTFYNYGPSGSISFVLPSVISGGVHLIAPTSGTYSGILFFQPTNNTSTATLVGSSSVNSVLEGTYYFPRATVNFTFSGAVNYNILVAYDISFNLATFALGTLSSSGFGNNYSSLATGSPLAGTGAVLTQ